MGTSETEPKTDWMECTAEQWEKKQELAMRNNNMGKALMFADYANCRSMYDSGKSIEEIQSRFGDIE